MHILRQLPARKIRILAGLSLTGGVFLVAVILAPQLLSAEPLGVRWDLTHVIVRPGPYAPEGANLWLATPPAAFDPERAAWQSLLAYPDGTSGLRGNDWGPLLWGVNPFGIPEYHWVFHVADEGTCQAFPTMEEAGGKAAKGWLHACGMQGVQTMPVEAHGCHRPEWAQAFVEGFFRQLEKLGVKGKTLTDIPISVPLSTGIHTMDMPRVPVETLYPDLPGRLGGKKPGGKAGAIIGLIALAINIFSSDSASASEIGEAVAETIFGTFNPSPLPPSDIGNCEPDRYVTWYLYMGVTYPSSGYSPPEPGHGDTPENAIFIRQPVPPITFEPIRAEWPWWGEYQTAW